MPTNCNDQHSFDKTLFSQVVVLSELVGEAMDLVTDVAHNVTDPQRILVKRRPQEARIMESLEHPVQFEHECLQCLHGILILTLTLRIAHQLLGDVKMVQGGYVTLGRQKLARFHQE